LQKPWIVGTRTEQGFERGDGLFVVARGVVSRGQIERQRRVRRRERQRRFRLGDRVDESSIRARERRADEAAFSRVGKIVEVFESRERELGSGARLPVARFGIVRRECGGQRRSMTAARNSQSGFPVPHAVG
jgi:hypothetical protein